MPVVTSGDSSITFSEGKSFRSLAQQKKMWVDFKAEFNKDVTSAQIGFSGYTTGVGDLDPLYNPLSLTKFAFDFSGKKIFDPLGQFVFSYTPDIPVRLQATVNPTGYDYYLNEVGIASNLPKENFIVSDFFVDVTGNSNARLTITDLIIDGDIKHSFTSTSPALIDYENPDIPIEISGSSISQYNEKAEKYLDTSEPYFSAIFKTETNAIKWQTESTGIGFQSDSIDDYSNKLSGLLETGIQYSGVIFNSLTDDSIVKEKFDILLNSNHGKYFIPTSIVDINNVASIADYNDVSKPALIKKNVTSSVSHKHYINKGDDIAAPPSLDGAPNQSDPNKLPDAQVIYLSNPEGYLLDFSIEEFEVEGEDAIKTNSHSDRIATNEYYINYRLIPLDPNRQFFDPYKNYKLPFKYAFISEGGNEGQYKLLKGIAFGDDFDYTSPLDGEEYTLSRGGKYSFIGNVGIGEPIHHDLVFPLGSINIAFTGAGRATGYGFLGASKDFNTITPTYGDTLNQGVATDQIAAIDIISLGDPLDSIDYFSPLIVGDIDYGVHPRFTGAAVLYNTTGYTKSLYDWALFSGDYLQEDGKQKHPLKIADSAEYHASFTDAYMTNGTALPFRLKHKFYADLDESKVKLVFSGIPTGDDVTINAMNPDGLIVPIHLGLVRISDDSQLQIDSALGGTTKQVVEIFVTGGVSLGPSGLSFLQDDTRILDNISLQVSGDSIDYFTTYPNYYNASTIGNTIPWDPKYLDSNGDTRSIS